MVEQNASNVSKLSRYHQRARFMVGTGMWVYYPEQDRFVEAISYQPGVGLIPCLMIYGRELYEASDATFHAFMSADQKGLDALDCNPKRDADRARRGVLIRPPSSGGIWTPDAFAMMRDGPIRRSGSRGRP